MGRILETSSAETVNVGNFEGACCALSVDGNSTRPLSNPGTVVGAGPLDGALPLRVANILCALS